MSGFARPEIVVLLGEDEIRSLLDWGPLIESQRRALISFSAGEVVQPTRNLIEIEPAKRYVGAMPAVGRDAMGLKFVSFYPGNAETPYPTHTATILLFDTAYGMPRAVLEGRLITEMRTAAVSAAVTEKLAAPDARILALIGSGVQAKAHLEALSTIRRFDEVRVWSRDPAKARAFAAAHGAVAMEIEDAVRGADVVVTATNAVEPIVMGRWLKPGAHVNAVGSPRPGWRELDDEAMASRVVVDSRAACLKESGDVILSGAAIAAEAGELLGGTVAIDPAETTVFKSVGIAVEDLAAAQLVYDTYLARRGDAAA